MVKIERLRSRDIREGLKHPRKRTWKFTIGRFSAVITVVPNPKYSPLSDKNILAFNLVKEYKLPGPKCFLALKKPLKIWIVSYTGENLLEVIKKSQIHSKGFLLEKAVKCLWDFSQSQPKKKKNKIPRYLSLLKKQIESQNKQRLFPNFLNLYRLLEKLNTQAIIGPGIEDPVISNFTTRNSKKVFLADFDNFKLNIPFYYEVGFLETDAKIEGVLEKDAFLKTKRETNDNLNVFLYRLGELSRYCIAYLNSMRNPNFDYGINTTTSRKKIEKLSFLLQRQEPPKFG